MSESVLISHPGVHENEFIQTSVSVEILVRIYSLKGRNVEQREHIKLGTFIISCLRALPWKPSSATQYPAEKNYYRFHLFPRKQIFRYVTIYKISLIWQIGSAEI